MIEAVFEALGGWTWWIVGMVLLAVEVVAPGMFFLWFGVAAILIGIGALFLDWSWQVEIAGFAVLSVVVALIGRKLMASEAEEPAETAQPLNDRVRSLKGRRLVLREPIVNGAGRAPIDDTVWRISGPDLPAGTPVIVTGSSGTALTVAPDAATP